MKAITFGARVKLGGFYAGLEGQVVGRKVVPRRQPPGCIYDYVDAYVYEVRVLALGQDFKVNFEEHDIVAWNTRRVLACSRTHWFGHGDGCYDLVEEWPQEAAP